jgi:RimJ/RimL family protein N-acetyltransferase
MEKFVKLERFKNRDIGSVLSWVKDEAQMVQWAGPVFDWPVTQKQFRTHLKAAKSKFTLYPFGLYHGSKIIGYCELSGHAHKHNSAIASRIIISPRSRNKGLGLFMLTKLLEFGFNEIGLNRIGLAVFDFNKSAIKCYKNAGFVLEGTLRQSSKVGDLYWNCHLMSILQKEWLAKYKSV